MKRQHGDIADINFPANARDFQDLRGNGSQLVNLTFPDSQEFTGAYMHHASGNDGELFTRYKPSEDPLERVTPIMQQVSTDIVLMDFSRDSGVILVDGNYQIKSIGKRERELYLELKPQLDALFNFGQRNF